MHSAHKNKDLFVIGIAFQSGTPKQVTSFAKKQGINYPVVIGDTESIKQIGQLEVLPVSYLYNPKGEQVKYFMGEVTRESIEAYIKNK